jgi:hypothetical protein
LSLAGGLKSRLGGAGETSEVLVRLMKFVLIVLLAMSGPGIAAGSKATAKAKAKDLFPTPESIMLFIDRYRLEPEPGRLPKVVHAMSRHGLLRDLDTAGVFIGFAAGVLGANPRQAGPLVVKMFPLPPEDQALVIKAIAYSGLSDWRQLMTSVIERMPARRVLIDKHLFGKEPALRDLSLDKGPAVLDINWGYYFATGSTEPVVRLMAALKWAKEAKDLNKLTVGGMAKWTLANNASREKELLDLCRSEVGRQPKEIAGPLREVIAAAEAYEAPRLRKEVLASIEDLRRKAPEQAKSGWVTASTVGSTALAVGCVVLSATGHVELAVPCVVTGALTSGATKLLGGQ